MRTLQTHDVFKAMKVVNALGVKEEVQRIALAMANGKKKFNQQEIGVELILNVIASAGDERAENLIYDFLAGPLELDPQDIKTMDPLKLIELLKEFGQYIDKDSWKAFFTSVAALLK